MKSKEGNAAIHVAAKYGHLECLKELHDNGADFKIMGPNK